MTDGEMMAYIFGILRSPSCSINGNYAYNKDYISEILEKMSVRLFHQPKKHPKIDQQERKMEYYNQLTPNTSLKTLPKVEHKRQLQLFTKDADGLYNNLLKRWIIMWLFDGKFTKIPD